MFKKIAIMHGKGKLSKIKESVCNIPIETANICNILPRPAVSNGLVVVKLKRDLKYKNHVYFEPLCPRSIYQELATDIVIIQGQNKNVIEKIISERRTRVKIEMTLKQNMLQLKIS